jgi:hypothetical protein
VLTVMPKPLVPEIRAWPETPDGCMEVTVEVNGVILATEVWPPAPVCDDARFRRAMGELQAAVRRRC